MREDITWQEQDSATREWGLRRPHTSRQLAVLWPLQHGILEVTAHPLGGGASKMQCSVMVVVSPELKFGQIGSISGGQPRAGAVAQEVLGVGSCVRWLLVDCGTWGSQHCRGGLGGHHVRE